MSGLNSVYNNVTFALQLHSKAIFSLQEQAETGSEVNRPSDNPSVAYRVLGLNSQDRYLANLMENIESAISMQDMTSSILQSMATTLSDTMADLTQIISGIYGEGEEGEDARERVALQINDILEQMVSFANTKYVDQYIFGGDNSSSIPYVVEHSDGEIVSVTYQGSTEGRNVEVSPGVQSDITYPGEDIFSSNNRQTPVFYGTTGADAGTGTSSVKGDLWLTVTHDGSNYKLSIDGGVTETTVPAVGDVSNIAVTNSDGEVLYIDATNITTTGTERVQVPGTYDIFNVLISTRDLLRNPNGLSQDVIADLVDQASEALEETRSTLVGKQSSIGAKINFLDSLKDNLENIKYNGEDETSMLQDADIAQIAIDISQRQLLYEMSLSVAGKLMSMSILDFI